MWQSFYKLSIMLLLSACYQKPSNIYPADDLNQFLLDKETKTFFVKKQFLQSVSCKDIENWAIHHLASETNYAYYEFVEYDDELTLQGNPWLKKDASAIIIDYNICRMNAKNKICYICK